MEYPHQPFNSDPRSSQSLRNDRCQNILYKAVLEHFVGLCDVAALLLTSKSFQNSSLGPNFLVNYIVDHESVLLFESVLSPSSCLSLQFSPSLRIRQLTSGNEKADRCISNFVGEMVKTKYFHLSLRSLKMDSIENEVLVILFGGTSNGWPLLRDLSLEYCRLTDKLLEMISKKALHVRTVNFSMNLEITDSGLEHISELSGITSIELRGCNLITDVILEHFSKLTNLTSLNLRWCHKITDAGLEHIAKLSGITELNLSGCKLIADAGLRSISRLSNMKSLNVSWCDLATDAGLQLLYELSGITSLDINGCGKITDAGVKHVTKLSNLISLDISFCGLITDDAIEELKNAMPNCVIAAARSVEYIPENEDQLPVQNMNDYDY